MLHSFYDCRQTIECWNVARVKWQLTSRMIDEAWISLCSESTSRPGDLARSWAVDFPERGRWWHGLAGWLAGDKPYLALTRIPIHHCVIINPFVVCILSTCLTFRPKNWHSSVITWPSMVPCRHDIINTVRVRILRCTIVGMMYRYYIGSVHNCY